MTITGARSRLVTDRAAAAAVIRAERAEGWIARCADAGDYLVRTRELVDALSGTLVGLGAPPVLEVCSGAGALAERLRERGFDVVATDRAPQPEANTRVERRSAVDAVRRHTRALVLASFVPYDGRIHEVVMAALHVRHYLVLGARDEVRDGLIPRLHEQGSWRADPLPEVRRRMITRHDGWLGGDGITRRGEAWLFSRASHGGRTE